MVKNTHLTFALGLMIAVGSVGSVFAQQASIALSQSEYNNRLPVEITADRLEVAQQANTAEFSGNAKAVQGDMQLSSDNILVLYNQEQSEIEQIIASGNVMFTNGAEVAEGDNGVYTLAKSEIVMTGNVMLLQGPNAVTGDRLSLDLITNKGAMSGNVKTIFVPKSDQ